MAERDGTAIPVVEGDNRDALARVLMRAGYRVVGAADSMQTPSILDRPQHVDIMIIDILMPRGRPHGLALGNSAERRRSGKAVYVTADYDQLPVEIAETNGPIVHKPARIADIVPAIEDSLKSTRFAEPAVDWTTSLRRVWARDRLLHPVLAGAESPD